MNKKTIYFHIGTHKTGTTALQNFFVTNKGVLKKYGLTYDFYNESEMNHGYLKDINKWKGINFDPKRSYILSGEVFYHCILKLKNIIDEKLYNFNINFIIYLKRQDLMKQSVYNQVVKMHGFYKDIEEENHYKLDYYEFLKELKSLYQNSCILVKVYEKAQFKDGNIFSDFLEILDLELTDEYKIENKVVNPSLTIDKLQFCRYINMLGLPVNLRVKINKLVIKTAVESKETELYRKQHLLSSKQERDIYYRYRESNIKIAKEFLNRESGELFYEPFSNENDGFKSYSDLNDHSAKKILTSIFEYDKKIVEKLYRLMLDSNSNSEEFKQSANFLTPILTNVLRK